MPPKQNKDSEATAELKRQLEALQQKVNKLANKNKSLEEKVDVLENTKRKLIDRVEVLETKMSVSENVTSRLTAELDRLDQYNRRSNLIIKNVNLPDDPKSETNEDIKVIVQRVIKDELQLPDTILDDVDKFHRNGHIKKTNNKQKQNIIVRFKSHSSRYACLLKKKSIKSNKIAPNLTRRRGKMLFDANKIIKDKQLSASIEFCFANIHGDLQVRLAEPVNGTKVHAFDSLKGLDDFLLEHHIIPEGYFCSDY